MSLGKFGIDESVEPVHMILVLPAMQEQTPGHWPTASPTRSPSNIISIRNTVIAILNSANLAAIPG